MIKGLIAYGTLTGNTELAARDLYRQLRETHPHIELKNIRDIQPEDIVSYDWVIFGTSTWDDLGNPDTDEFLKAVSVTKPDYGKVRFALFGLGDSSYQNFCGALSLVKEALAQCHCAIYESTYTIDGYPEASMLAGLTAWAQAFLATHCQCGKNVI